MPEYLAIFQFVICFRVLQDSFRSDLWVASQKILDPPLSKKRRRVIVHSIAFLFRGASEMEIIERRRCQVGKLWTNGQMSVERAANCQRGNGMSKSC